MNVKYENCSATGRCTTSSTVIYFDLVHNFVTSTSSLPRITYVPSNIFHLFSNIYYSIVLRNSDNQYMHPSNISRLVLGSIIVRNSC